MHSHSPGLFSSAIYRCVVPQEFPWRQGARHWVRVWDSSSDLAWGAPERSRAREAVCADTEAKHRGLAAEGRARLGRDFVQGNKAGQEPSRVLRRQAVISLSLALSASRVFAPQLFLHPQHFLLSLLVPNGYFLQKQQLRTAF